MTHQDPTNSDTNTTVLKDLVRCLLPDEAEFPSRHGTAQYDSYWLAVVGIVAWGWTQQTTLDERFETACSVVNQVLGKNYSGTRQGLQKAVRKLDQVFLHQVIQRFSDFAKNIKDHWSAAGKVNFAVDGTKFAAPRTAANQAAFSAKATTKKRKKYGSKSAESKAATVQILATVIWHISTGLPFRWTLDSSAGSERKNLVSMLDQLPSNARLIADAEYVGYPFWTAMMDSKKSFLVRVGSNMRFLKDLGQIKFSDGYVYYWPDSVSKRDEKPLILRLFELHDGKKTIYVLTNELEMTDRQASKLYRSRWGIEVFFRAVKQSCQRRKLCCRSPENLIAELNWTLLGIWAALSLGKTTLQQAGQPISRLSPVRVIRAFHKTVTAISLYAQPKQTLIEQLAKAIIADESNRTTSKKSRNYPGKKKKQPCGKPKLTTATKEQKQQAKKFNV